MPNTPTPVNISPFDAENRTYIEDFEKLRVSLNELEGILNALKGTHSTLEAMLEAEHAKRADLPLVIANEILTLDPSVGQVSIKALKYNGVNTFLTTGIVPYSIRIGDCVFPIGTSLGVPAGTIYWLKILSDGSITAQTQMSLTDDIDWSSIASPGIPSLVFRDGSWNLYTKSNPKIADLTPDPSVNVSLPPGTIIRSMLRSTDYKAAGPVWSLPQGGVNNEPIVLGFGLANGQIYDLPLFGDHIEYDTLRFMKTTDAYNANSGTLMDIRWADIGEAAHRTSRSWTYLTSQPTATMPNLLGYSRNTAYEVLLLGKNAQYTTHVLNYDSTNTTYPAYPYSRNVVVQHNSHVSYASNLGCLSRYRMYDGFYFSTKMRILGFALESLSLPSTYVSMFSVSSLEGETPITYDDNYYFNGGATVTKYKNANYGEAAGRVIFDLGMYFSYDSTNQISPGVFSRRYRARFVIKSRSLKAFGDEFHGRSLFFNGPSNTPIFVDFAPTTGHMGNRLHTNKHPSGVEFRDLVFDLKVIFQDKNCKIFVNDAEVTYSVVDATLTNASGLIFTGTPSLDNVATDSDYVFRDSTIMNGVPDRLALTMSSRNIGKYIYDGYVGHAPTNSFANVNTALTVSYALHDPRFLFGVRDIHPLINWSAYNNVLTYDTTVYKAINLGTATKPVLSKTEYAALYAVVGDRFSTSDLIGTGFFSVPYGLAGYMTRGDNFGYPDKNFATNAYFHNRFDTGSGAQDGGYPGNTTAGEVVVEHYHAVASSLLKELNTPSVVTVKRTSNNTFSNWLVTTDYMTVMSSGLPAGSLIIDTDTTGDYNIAPKNNCAVNGIAENYYLITGR